MLFKVEELRCGDAIAASGDLATLMHCDAGLAADFASIPGAQESNFERQDVPRSLREDQH
jgi:hypothetical protein